MSDLEYSCAAWYSDVVHEVKPITSGYRLVLIYNLVQGSSGPITTAASRTDSKSRLKNVLSQWSAICNRDNPGISRILAYKLSYKYSISSLSFNTLKGSDNVKFQHLDEVCKEKDFLLYLAHIKKEDSGACADNNAWRYDEDSARRDNGYETDEYQRLRNGPTADEKQDFGGCHEIIEFHRRSIQLTRVLDQNRTEVAKNIDFAIEDIAQGNIFKRAPDYENYTGYTGNEGVSTTHFYNDTIILVLPRRFRVDLLYMSVKTDPDHVLTWIKRLQDDLDHTPDASTKLKLQRLCELIIKQRRKITSSRLSWAREDGNSNTMMTAVARAALKVDDVVLLKEALQLLEGPPPLRIFGLIRTAIPGLGFVKLRPALWVAFKKLTEVDSRRSALLRIAGTPSATSGESLGANDRIVDEWISAHIGSILSPQSSLTADDGTSLADMTKDFGPATLMQGIVPCIEIRSDNPAFSLAFLFRLFELRDGRIPASTLGEAYSKILGKLITQQADSEQGISKHKFEISASQYMQILEHCEILSLDGSIGSVFEKIEDVASAARIEAFGILLLPYLDLLLAYLEERASDSILTNDCSDHVYTILETFSTRYVRPEPRNPAYRTCLFQSVRCCCHDCLGLKAFMEDDNRKTWEKRVVQARRKHLQGQVSRELYRCETIASGMPHLLVITKVHGTYLQEHWRWRRRFNEARALIGRLDSNPWLRQLLGDTHDEIVNLRMICRLFDTISSNPSGITNSPAEQGSSNKRSRPQSTDGEEADQTKRSRTIVIDLTSD
jgi:hypothetical protein